MIPCLWLVNRPLFHSLPLKWLLHCLDITELGVIVKILLLSFISSLRLHFSYVVDGLITDSFVLCVKNMSFVLPVLTECFVSSHHFSVILHNVCINAQNGFLREASAQPDFLGTVCNSSLNAHQLNINNKLIGLHYLLMTYKEMSE